MNRLECILRSSLVSLLRFDHPPDSGVNGASEVEVCQNFAINFVEAGLFELTVQKKSWMLSEGRVFVSRPGTIHRYDHDDKSQPRDVCVSVIYDRRLTEEIKSGDLFPPQDASPALPVTNRLAFLNLRRKALGDGTDNLTLETWAFDLIAAVRSGAVGARRTYRARQLSWYAERVEAARQLLEGRFAEAHSLASLADAVGMSPFQFARVFNELAGLPPHRYLIGVRLSRALEMIRDGVPVTSACFEVGFSNLSHFTRSFRRKFGVAPSSLKRAGHDAKANTFINC